MAAEKRRNASNPSCVPHLEIFLDVTEETTAVRSFCFCRSNAGIFSRDGAREGDMAGQSASEIDIRRTAVRLWMVSEDSVDVDMVIVWHQDRPLVAWDVAPVAGGGVELSVSGLTKGNRIVSGLFEGQRDGPAVPLPIGHVSLFAFRNVHPNGLRFRFTILRGGVASVINQETLFRIGMCDAEHPAHVVTVAPETNRVSIRTLLGDGPPPIVVASRRRELAARTPPRVRAWVRCMARDADAELLLKIWVDPDRDVAEGVNKTHLALMFRQRSAPGDVSFPHVHCRQRDGSPIEDAFLTPPTDMLQLTPGSWTEFAFAHAREDITFAVTYTHGHGDTAALRTCSGDVVFSVVGISPFRATIQNAVSGGEHVTVAQTPEIIAAVRLPFGTVCVTRPTDGDAGRTNSMRLFAWHRKDMFFADAEHRVVFVANGEPGPPRGTVLHVFLGAHYLCAIGVDADAERECVCEFPVSPQPVPFVVACGEEKRISDSEFSVINEPCRTAILQRARLSVPKHTVTVDEIDIARTRAFAVTLLSTPQSAMGIYVPQRGPVILFAAPAEYTLVAVLPAPLSAPIEIRVIALHRNTRTPLSVFLDDSARHTSEKNIRIEANETRAELPVSFVSYPAAVRFFASTASTVIRQRDRSRLQQKRYTIMPPSDSVLQRVMEGAERVSAPTSAAILQPPPSPPPLLPTPPQSPRPTPPQSPEPCEQQVPAAPFGVGAAGSVALSPPPEADGEVESYFASPPASPPAAAGTQTPPHVVDEPMARAPAAAADQGNFDSPLRFPSDWLMEVDDRPTIPSERPSDFW
jgi:hypothetical protein